MQQLNLKLFPGCGRRLQVMRQPGAERVDQQHRGLTIRIARPLQSAAQCGNCLAERCACLDQAPGGRAPLAVQVEALDPPRIIRA